MFVRKPVKWYYAHMDNRIMLMMVVGLLVGLLGCDDSEGVRAAEALAHGAATNACSRSVTSNRVVFVKETHGKNIVLERPANFGVDANEYARLTAFVDSLLFANGRHCTECLSRVLYSDAEFFSMAVYCSQTGEPSALKKAEMFEGAGISGDDLLPSDVRLGTFSRRLGRRLAFEDVFLSESVMLIRNEMVRHLSLYVELLLLPTNMPQMLSTVSLAKFREGLNNFAIERTYNWQPSVRFALPGGWVGVDGRQLEISLCLPDEVFRSGVLPLREAFAPSGAGSGGPIVYDRIVFAESIPSAFAKQDEATHQLEVRIEYPVGGFPKCADPAAVSAFLGSVLTGGVVKDKTVEAAIGELRRNFRKTCAEEDADAHEKGESLTVRSYFCRGQVLFMDDRYLSYRNGFQHDCSCGMGETLGVFGFARNRALTSHDFIKPESRAAVCQLLRQQAVKDRNDADGSDSPDLPSYVPKGSWPATLENFSVDARGITWSYDSGYVYFTGKGPNDTLLTWAQLRPHLISPDVMPSCATGANGVLK